MKKKFIICMLLLSSLSIFAQTKNQNYILEEYLFNDKIYKLYYFDSEEALRENFVSILKQSPYNVVNNLSSLKEELIYDLKKVDEENLSLFYKDKTPMIYLNKNKDKFKFCLSVYVFSISKDETEKYGFNEYQYDDYVQVLLLRNIDNNLYMSNRYRRF